LLIFYLKFGLNIKKRASAYLPKLWDNYEENLKTPSITKTAVFHKATHHHHSHHLGN